MRHAVVVTSVPEWGGRERFGGAGSVAVTLTRLDPDMLEALLGVAVRDAEPEEVMPPVDGPPGWTPQRIAAFQAFYRERLPGLAGPHATVMFAILADGEVVGMIRMSRVERGVMQTGIWLGRSARGMGMGSAALCALLEEATKVGAQAVVAETTAGNAGALGALRRCRAHLSYADRTDDAAPVHAVMTPSLSPITNHPGS